MNVLLNLPLTVRLVGLGLLGVVIGGLLNAGIYGLAWNRRAIGPWLAADPAAGPRSWLDRLPLLGWWRLRREAHLHGARYWVRPLLIELATGLGLAGLYWFEVHLGLYPPLVAAPEAAVIHAQYLAHAILLCFMIVATFIDFDEQTIPDGITLPGAMLGVLLAALLPSMLLPSVALVRDGLPIVHHLIATTSTREPGWISTALGGPESWPPAWDGTRGLMIGLACLTAWYLAVIPKHLTLRRGLWKGIVYMLVGIVRHRYWILSTICASAGLLVTLISWWIGGPPWHAVLTSLCGMVFGGALVWSVRIIGKHALQAEAMGFGDVTLMAMIGAFLGWQATLLIFFAAPFAALLIAVAQWLVTRRNDIAFGPYLCLAAVGVIVGWNRIWTQWCEPFFSLGWFLPAIVAGGVLLMGLMLWIWRLVRDRF